MKQLIQNLKTGELTLKDVPCSLCKPKGVVVKTLCSLISAGTEKSIIGLARKNLLGKARSRPDLLKRALDKAKKEGFIKVFRESLERLDEPFPLGYSASGIVVQVGTGVKSFSVGEKVAIAGSGYANHSEYNFVPENLCMTIPKRKTGQHVDFDEVVFCMLGGIAIQGIREAQLSFGENVVVIGLGLLGLITVQILKAVGCGVIGVDIVDSKCKLAKQLGCDEVFADQQSLIENYQDTLDAVLITAATKSVGPLETAQKITRQKGRIILVGDCDIHLERKYFWDKELEFKVSKAAGPGIMDENYEVKGIDYPIAYIRWPEKKNMEYFLRLVSEDKVKLKELITHRFEFNNAISAYNMLLKGKESYIGVILEYEEELPDKDIFKQLSMVVKNDHIPEALNKNRANIGFIGGGMFTKNILLPSLVKIKNINLVGIATTRGITSEHLASKFSFNYATSNYQQLFQDTGIQSIFITTRHDLHAKMITEALKAGKNIFVEKPLCLNREELKEIAEAYNADKSILMVGFNRRYSPHALDIKNFFNDANTPFVINYRINAGYLDSNHWIHDNDIGGGRIIGEVCHFVDFLQFITGSNPIKVYAESIMSTEKYKTDDNIIVTINFENGSIGTITYTAQGSKAYPREIVEIFQNQSIYYLEDFKVATKVKNNKRSKMKFLSQEMGYIDELKRFISQQYSPKDTYDCFVNALTTFAILDSLKQGKPLPVGDTL